MAITIDIFGPITEKSLNVSQLAKRLEEKENDVVVRIDSRGGDYDVALTAYNLLKNSSKNVTTINMGHAFSAASLLFLAGDQRVANIGSTWMIHNIKSIDESGNAKMFEKTAQMLNKLDDDWLNIVAERTDLSKEDARKFMDAEEYLTSKETVKYGISTAEEYKGKIAACVDFSDIRNVENFKLKLNIMEKEIEKELKAEDVKVEEVIKEEVKVEEKKAEVKIEEVLASILAKLDMLVEKMTVAPVVEVEAKKEASTEKKNYSASVPLTISDVKTEEFNDYSIAGARKYIASLKN